LDDLQHAARQRTAQQGTTDLDRGRRLEADRIVADLQRTLQAARAAERDAAMTALNDRAEAILHTVREQTAPQIAVARRDTTERRESNFPQFKNQVTRLLRNAPPDSSTEHGIAPRVRATNATAPVFASLNDLDGKLRRRCPSILDSAIEYDDDLVALCQSWRARR
jgi:hypothetical protein